MRKLLVVLAVVAALSLLVVGTTSAQGPVERPNMPGTPQFQDEDGDGVCDVCGNTEPGQMGRRGGVAGQGGLMMGGRWNGVTLLSTVAEALDMSVQDVWAQVQEGNTLRQVIEAKDANPEAIVEQYVEARKAVLDQLVADERITQDQADLMLEHLREEATEHLDEAEFFGGKGRWNGKAPSTGVFGGRGGRGGRGVTRMGTSA